MFRPYYLIAFVLCLSAGSQRTEARIEEDDQRIRRTVQREQIKKVLEALLEEEGKQEQKRDDAYNYYEDTDNQVAPPANDGGTSEVNAGGVAPPAPDSAGIGGGGGGNKPDTSNTSGGTSTDDSAIDGAPSSGKMYLIVSKFAGGKAIEIKPDRPLEAAKVQMWDKRDRQDKTQLWVTDSNGFIRSAFDSTLEFCDSSKSDAGRWAKIFNGRRTSQRVGDLSGLEIHMANSGHKGGNWKWASHGQIVNSDGYALTIANANKENGAVLIQHTTDAEDHKVWSYQYTSPSRRHQYK